MRHTPQLGGALMVEQSPVLDWLRSGVPLSLLLDLASPDGPDSAEIIRTEHA